VRPRSNYSDPALLNLRGAIERLPDILTPPASERLRATGTDNLTAESVVLSVVLNGPERCGTEGNTQSGQVEQPGANQDPSLRGLSPFLA
jgi:hypothetical protein